MTELRTDQHVHEEAHGQPDGFFLFARTKPNTILTSAVAESSSPKQSSELADPATRLEQCISLQAMAIALLEDERRTPLEQAGRELLALLRETIRHQHAITLDFRMLQVEMESLRIERDELAVALRHTEALSLTDELTGLPNRRAFGQRLEQELSRRDPASACSA